MNGITKISLVFVWGALLSVVTSRVNTLLEIPKDSMRALFIGSVIVGGGYVVGMALLNVIQNRIGSKQEDKN